MCHAYVNRANFSFTSFGLVRLFKALVFLLRHLFCKCTGSLCSDALNHFVSNEICLQSSATSVNYTFVQMLTAHKSRQSLLHCECYQVFGGRLLNLNQIRNGRTSSPYLQRTPIALTVKAVFFTSVFYALLRYPFTVFTVQVVMNSSTCIKSYLGNSLRFGL